jgi:hypothetical protein
MAIMFDYTQSKFWGGSWYPYWSLILMTTVLGFFGLDHVWLRSPLSGFLKFIINIFTLGLWYFYDILQVLGEKDSVMKNGLSAPFVGPLGIGAGMFKDSNPDSPTARSPLRFMAYMFLLMLPFGIDLYVAGDSNGAIVKFILTILIIFVIPFFIAVIWGFVNMGRSVLMPKDLFTKGTYRMFPVSWFMDPLGPSILGPVDIPAGVGECGSGGAGSIVGSMLQRVPVIAAAGAAVDAATAAADVATAAAKGASAAIETTTNAYQNIVDSVVKPATRVIGTGATLGSQMTALKAQIPTKEGLASAAVNKLIQKGGGGDSGANLALLGLFIIILGGGTISAANRMGLNSYLFNKQKEDDNDTPPEP